MSRAPVVLVLLVAAALPLSVARPALACSCAPTNDRPSIEFVGEALDDSRPGTLGRVWAFRVVTGRGVNAGEVVAINLDVNYTSGDGGMVASSCSLGDAPNVGERYRVGAYQGTVNDEVRYFANLCGGYLQAVSDVNAPSPSSRPPLALIVVASVALVGALVASVRAGGRPT